MGQTCGKGNSDVSPPSTSVEAGNGGGAAIGGDNIEAVGAHGEAAAELHTSRPPAPHVRNNSVFLNHRGPDVKKGFVDHLSASLETSGVHCFVDHEKLKVGEENWDAIMSAIHHCKIHIAIFTTGYADSPWCLRELHEMLECRRNGSSDLFLPVFYNVSPGDLHLASHQSCYSSAFTSLAARHESNLVQLWKMALHEASTITGWTLDHAAQGFEGRLVKLIVSEVLNVLNRTLLDVAKHPVGVNEILQEALNLMEIDKPKKGVQIFGIFGMGGVGKTTLAKSIYNGIYREFECYSYTANVRSEAKAPTGLRSVQERMICALLKNEDISITSTSHGRQIMKERFPGLKILIVLDDVDAQEQLDELLPPLDSCHLRDGSLIVITTRDEQIVIWAKAQQSLSMHGLSAPHADLLFSWHAFLRREEPSEDFKRLAKKVVGACQGLPLALEVLGSHLYTKDITFWERTVKVLEGQRGTLGPAQRQVTSILRISFDGLSSEEERSMFLDIACFFLGEGEARAKRIWQESDTAELCLETLKLKCLVKLDQEGRLMMHDLLRDMGREIVEASHKNVWQRSHLWNENDVRFVLRNKKATSDVRGLRLTMTEKEEWDTTAFAGMDVLQLLVLQNGNIKGDFSLFSKEIRWFQWRNCPLESLPLELALDRVAVLDLMGSKISKFSAGHRFENLLELILSDCSNLKELPEFSEGLNNLELINLRRCVNLESLPDSIGCLSSSLRHLDLSECRKLTTLPDGIVQLHSLRALFLNKCTSLSRLPDAIGQLHSLQEIGLAELSLKLLPESFGNLTNLSYLHLHDCSKLTELPFTIGNLRKLTSFGIFRCPLIQKIPQGASSLTNLVNLEATGCRSLSTLPDNIGNLSKLVTLNLQHNAKLSYLPSSIGQLKELISLELWGCAIADQGLPTEISTLSSLQKLSLQYNALSILPKDFHLLTKLQKLEVHHCRNLREIPHLPPSLTFLDIGDCPALARFSCLSTLRSLRDLVLCNCTGLVELTGLDCLLHLEELNITGCKGIAHLPQLTKLASLRFLHLAGSGVSLMQDDAPWISKLVSLEHLSVYREKLPECFSSCTRNFQKGVSKQHADHFVFEVKVPEREMACKGVVCCFVSHDQGRSDFEWEHGRYSHSFTNVQARVMVGESENKKVTQLLLVNRHADRRNQLHVSIYRDAHPFVASLKAGDTIRIFGISVFPGWAGTVNGGAIKLIYEDNEMEQILDEMSQQAKCEENVHAPISTHQPGHPHQPPPQLPHPRRPQDPVSLELMDWIENGGFPEAYATLQSLQRINLQSMPITQLPGNFHLLTNLRSLELRRCSHLHEVLSLPPTLTELDLGDCPNLRAVLCLSTLLELRALTLCNCSGLVELVGLDRLIHLLQLNISGCIRLMSLPNGLEKLKSLKYLFMAGSGVSLLQDNEPWIQKLASLECLSVYGEQVPGCLPKVEVEGVIAKQQANVCCMEVAVPELDAAAAAAYKGALFCFVSHDQGFSSYPWDHGRYRNNHTSMHAEIIESGAADDHPKFSQVLFGNRHADGRSQLHISIFRAPHPFVASLKGGDKIRALARSVFPGWAITVREGAAQLLSGEDEMDETLRILSRGLA